jgi:arginine deiminase
MHLDTIFTQINYNHFVGFKPIILDGLGSNVEVMRKNGSTAVYSSLSDFLRKEISGQIEFTWSGDGQTPYQEREQWTDGCNLVAIKPGVAITYDRNPHTEKAFEKAGYSILHANDLLQQITEDNLDVSKIENTIITLPSNELSRARGGSHCMTCPIHRENL